MLGRYVWAFLFFGVRWKARRELGYMNSIHSFDQMIDVSRINISFDVIQVEKTNQRLLHAVSEADSL